MLIFIGILSLCIGGALLHDVPFQRFILAMVLMSMGQTFLVLGLK